MCTGDLYIKKETYKRDVQMNPTEETKSRCEFEKETYIQEKIPAKETYK